MVLKDLLTKLNYELINGKDDIEINDLTPDSRNVGRGDVFVCIQGSVSDGHSYIPEVVAKGAAAVITARNVEITDSMKNITVIKTEDTRVALAYMSAAFFGYPANELFTIGITGTKGKTTTSYMVREIMEACKIKTGLIGTVEIIVDEYNKFPSHNTTPESYDVQRYFRKMADNGCKCVVMEVSSQALMLHRVAGIEFDIGAFTNLEPDHIGPNEHPSFENYAECKGMLFKQCKTGIINIDSEYADTVLKGHTCDIETFGLGEKAGLRGTGIVYTHNAGQISTAFDTVGEKNIHIDLRLPGKFSVYNSLCATAIAGCAGKTLNIKDEGILRGLRNVKVPGRIELMDVSRDFIVMIDYAHNAMALENLLSTLKEYNPGRIVTLFGCGGNRSKLRRFEMGEIAGKMSDFTIVTSDNPRNEEPLDIMKDIETGILKTSGKYIMIEDRKEAVRYALAHGTKGDIIVLAGKGHEDYQEIKGKRYHMTDRELVEEAAKELA